MLLYGIDNFVWTSGSGRGETGGSSEKFSGGEGGAERRMRLLRARGSAEHGNVASGFATQGLWLGERKNGISASRQRLSRPPGRRTVGRVERGRASDRTQERIHRFRVRFSREKSMSLAIAQPWR